MIASRPTSPTGTSKIGERKVAEQLLAQVPLHPTVTTFDALHTSVKQAEQIRTGGGHSLFIVKRNPRTLYQDIRWEHSNTWRSSVAGTGRLRRSPLPRAVSLGEARAQVHADAEPQILALFTQQFPAPSTPSTNPIAPDQRSCP
jgi:hypothetical protein